MTYSQEIKNQSLQLFLSGINVTFVHSILKNSFNKTPHINTLYKWKKEGMNTSNVGIKNDIFASQSIPIINYENINIKKGNLRNEWALKRYSEDEKQEGTTLLNKAKKVWDKNTTQNKYTYDPKKLDFTESYAREKYHGKSLEDKLHLGIYQVKNSNTTQVRSKKLIKEGKEVTSKLTSQNHIFPDSKIKDKDISYHPENIREGHAEFNNAISDHLDPIFFNNGKSLSQSTIDIIKKYSLKPLKTLKDFDSKASFKKYLKDQPTFKYNDIDRIVTSNMTTQLTKNLKGSYEAPELGILDGPKVVGSMNTYSVPLYKIDNSAGIIDTSTRNLDLKKQLYNKSQDIKEFSTTQTYSKIVNNINDYKSEEKYSSNNIHISGSSSIPQYLEALEDNNKSASSSNNDYISDSSNIPQYLEALEDNNKSASNSNNDYISDSSNIPQYLEALEDNNKSADFEDVQYIGDFSPFLG